MNIRLPFGILTILAGLALTCCAADVSADQLKSPWDGQPVALTDAEYTCPDPPPFSQSLDAEGYYIDAHHSVIDPVKKAAYEKAAEAPDHLGQWTTQAADDYLRHGSRAGMALHYHLYALAPLIMLAELGEANGIDTYSENHNAIDRLVNLCEQGLKHPEIFEKATGVEQNMPDKISGAVIGWAVPYVKRHPDPQLSAWLSQAGSTAFWQYGGLPPS